MYSRKKDSKVKISADVPVLDGLAISYEPPYQKEKVDEMGWANNEVPLIRMHEPTKIRYDSVAYDRASCVDSLLDSYADMYHSDVEEEDEDWHNEEEDPEVDEYNLNSSNHHPIITEEPEVKPWDQRGKNGLYGGGGRGAENKETGWGISSYYANDRDAIRATQVEAEESYLAAAGVTGELPEDPAGNHSGNQFGIRGGQPLQNHQRNSSESDQSEYEPITPVGPAFPRASNPPFNTEISSTPIAPNRPTIASQIRKASAPAIIAIESGYRKVTENEGAVGQPPRRKSEPIISRQGTKKKSPPPPLDISKTRGDSTSPPIASPLAPLASATLQAESKRRKSLTPFTWPLNRKSKTPIISNPILPLGFVESLGMATFELTPGCLPPNSNPSFSSKPSRTPISKKLAPKKKIRKLVSKESIRAADITDEEVIQEAMTASPKSSIADFRTVLSNMKGDTSEASSNYTHGSVASVVVEEELNRQLYFNGVRNSRKTSVAEISGPVLLEEHQLPPIQPLRNISVHPVPVPFSTFSTSDSDSYSGTSHTTATTVATSTRKSALREESKISYLQTPQKFNSYSKLSINSSRPPSANRTISRKASPTGLGELGRRPSHDYGGTSSISGPPPMPTTTTSTSSEGGWQPGW